VRPRFFAPDIDVAARVVELPADEAHHLTHVLRLRVGDELAVFDGRGHEWIGRIAAVTRRRVDVELLEPATPVMEPRIRLTLAVAILKGDQMDVVVRDATMLGVAAIVPLISAHVVAARGPRTGGGGTARWHRIAVASSKQCRRAVVPAISDPVEFEALLKRDDERRVMCVEPSSAVAASQATLAAPSPSAVLFIGPEGGWSVHEIDRARDAGVEFMSLGPRTLRAEAAPAVALAALWTMWGWE